MSLHYKQIHFLGTPRQQPVLEISTSSRRTQILPFVKQTGGRLSNKQWWQVEPKFLTNRKWKFRIILEGKVVFPQHPREFHTTFLEKLWYQNGEIFNYSPAPSISPSKVFKIPKFKGNLSTRPLYVYLPRGYPEHTNRYYPVIYMHDGQNCFESFVEDSCSGSWRAEQAADLSIGQGLMQECLIVGVSHGGKERLWEYLPPYARYPLKKQMPEKRGDPFVLPKKGRADQTLEYYQNYVAPYIRKNYRVLHGRKDIATCGSSMGGLFSYYIAWEFPQFARQHAIVSPSYWITRNESGVLEEVEKIRSSTERREVRLWLDSGTQYSPDHGDDGMHDTRKVRDALLELGYEQGKDFQYHLAKGSVHHESSWAARLPSIFQFFFPLD